MLLHISVLIFYSCIIFHYINVSQFICLSFDGHLCYFHFGVMNTAISVCVEVFITHFFSFTCQLFLKVKAKIIFHGYVILFSADIKFSL